MPFSRLLPQPGDLQLDDLADLSGPRGWKIMISLTRFENSGKKRA